MRLNGNLTIVNSPCMFVQGRPLVEQKTGFYRPYAEMAANLKLFCIQLN